MLCVDLFQYVDPYLYGEGKKTGVGHARRDNRWLDSKNAWKSEGNGNPSSLPGVYSDSSTPGPGTVECLVPSSFHLQ